MNALVKPTDEELTPESCWRPVLEALGIDRFGIDVCSHEEQSVPAFMRFSGPAHGGLDGLRAQWRIPGGARSIKWCNPPYSDPYSWAQRCAEESDSVLLISGDTSTKMWREIIWPRAMAVVFWYGRIAFYSPHNKERKTGAKRSSALVIFGDIVKDWAPLEAVGRIIVP